MLMRHATEDTAYWYRERPASTYFGREKGKGKGWAPTPRAYTTPGEPHPFSFGVTPLVQVFTLINFSLCKSFTHSLIS